MWKSPNIVTLGKNVDIEEMFCSNCILMIVALGGIVPFFTSWFCVTIISFFQHPSSSPCPSYFLSIFFGNNLLKYNLHTVQSINIYNSVMFSIFTELCSLLSLPVSILWSVTLTTFLQLKSLMDFPRIFYVLLCPHFISLFSHFRCIFV